MFKISLRRRTNSRQYVSLKSDGFRLWMAVRLFEAKWILVFLWRTLALMLILRKSSVSVYDPACQAWARARSNFSASHHLYSEPLTPTSVSSFQWAGETSKTAVWAAVQYVRSKPFGKPLATYLKARIQNSLR